MKCTVQIMYMCFSSVFMLTIIYLALWKIVWWNKPFSTIPVTKVAVKSLNLNKDLHSSTTYFTIHMNFERTSWTPITSSNNNNNKLSSLFFMSAPSIIPQISTHKTGSFPGVSQYWAPCISREHACWVCYEHMVDLWKHGRAF